MNNHRDIGCGVQGLRRLATISMVLDHIGALILKRLIECGKMEEAGWINATYLYWALRVIGRIAFPIFAFLLCEGFLHTRNLKKYAARLLAFAIISEIPFDLAVKGKQIDWSYQNVMITLFIALMMLYVISRMKNIVVVCSTILAATALCYLLKTDYAILGPSLVAAFYLFRDKGNYRYLAAGIIIVILGTGITKVFGLVPLVLLAVAYNGQLGKHNKYTGYIFYPVHLLLIWLLNTVIA